MLLLASEKVSGISFGDQILARWEENRTLRTVVPPPIGEAVFDQEDGNLVGNGRGYAEVGYGSEGSEKGVRMDEGGSGWACWLSPSPVLSMFCPLPMSMASSGTKDSGMKGISSWEAEVGMPKDSIIVSPAGCESGTSMVVGFSGEGWYEEAIAVSSARAWASTFFTLSSPKMEARAVWKPIGRGVGVITGVSGPVFEPRCTKYLVVQPSSSRTSGKGLPGTTVRARRLTPLFGHSEAWRIEDPVGRQPLRVRPKGDPRLRMQGEAGPGVGEGDFRALGCPWTLLTGEVDIVRRKQSVTKVCNCFLMCLEALG